MTRPSRPKLARLQPTVRMASLGIASTATTAGTERIRGRRLQMIRETWFRRHPLCVHCEKAGRVRLATQLDHIVALVNGGDDFDRDRGLNRQGLCDPCHEAKTAADLGHRSKGCDVNGLPLDPNHPWNQGTGGPS